LSGSQDQLL